MESAKHTSGPAPPHIHTPFEASGRSQKRDDRKFPRSPSSEAHTVQPLEWWEWIPLSAWLSTCSSACFWAVGTEMGSEGP